MTRCRTIGWVLSRGCLRCERDWALRGRNDSAYAGYLYCRPKTSVLGVCRCCGVLLRVGCCRCLISVGGKLERPLLVSLMRVMPVVLAIRDRSLMRVGTDLQRPRSVGLSEFGLSLLDLARSGLRWSETRSNRP